MPSTPSCPRVEGIRSVEVSLEDLMPSRCYMQLHSHQVSTYLGMFYFCVCRLVQFAALPWPSSPPRSSVGALAPSFQVRSPAQEEQEG